MMVASALLWTNSHLAAGAPAVEAGLAYHCAHSKHWFFQ